MEIKFDGTLSDDGKLTIDVDAAYAALQELRQQPPPPDDYDYYVSPAGDDAGTGARIESLCQPN